ncbi:hypothetical protein G7075_04290 [Phycicoccus sp. HDW14]|uniref:hypothetical protein n=1 Tax=Phycicoccus sp. HDW14 TaxID=2714941 RepID=UPI001407C543|nr:hypothetical protein [Phycicoccus sp. HDW14]QIM20537.1 hypothetical protein G7075_04290 [Phycicoccus sp. HDW14]
MTVLKVAKTGEQEADLRQFLSYLFAQDSAGIATDGVLTGLAVTQTSTASSSVQIDVGAAVVQDSRLAGAFPMLNNALFPLDVLGPNPMGGVPRNDIVVMDYATESVRVIVGTPNAVPTDPSVPATAVRLARLRHAAGALTIPSNKIEDLRLPTRLFGVVPPTNTGWVDGAGIFTANSGWSISGSLYKRYGDVVSVQINVTRTGGALAAGNIGNLTIANIDPALTPAQSNGALGGGPSGSDFAAYASTGGGVVLTATSQAIANGDAVNVFGTYLL